MHQTSYQTVIEIEDWGATVTKVIVDLGVPVPENSVSKDTFKIHVSKKDDRFNMVPIDRTLIKECFIYRYFFIYFNFKIMGIRGQHE
ncbi:hypothetical protein I7822_06815 [Metabacillus sp. BG109]|uniref:Esterase Ig-like N-terminal domain-containing protein n=2 Tax=Metabacillus bambusae TaxID=2795218 RepID=A0ABS3MZD2_9BACI|nr:hypothetical protein [Metabacillus bambusae]